jgi:hypothetical protein
VTCGFSAQLLLDIRCDGAHFQKMRLRNLSPVKLSGVFAAIFVAASIPLLAAGPDTTYTGWVKSWIEKPVTSPALDGAGLKLVVSRVQGEVEAAAIAAMTPVERTQLAYHIKVSAAEVATNGSFRTYFISNTDARTSVVRELAHEDFQLLDQLLEQLPDDHAQLPPAGERIVVQFLKAGQWQVRVYDGKKLQLGVKDLMALLAKPYDQLF